MIRYELMDLQNQKTFLQLSYTIIATLATTLLLCPNYSCMVPPCVLKSNESLQNISTTVEAA
jgi:hypothetical protein